MKSSTLSGHYTAFAYYRFLGPIFGNLSEQPLTEDVQVVRDAQGSPSRIVPHGKTIPQTPAEEIKGLKIEIDIYKKNRHFQIALDFM